MSQRIFPARTPERRLEVVAGWDRPLQCLFLTVFDLDDERHAVAFSNLDQRDPSMSLAEIEAVLVSGFGLTLPATFLRDLERDRASNVGNLVHRYDPPAGPPHAERDR